jgi:hypothetical protein
MYNSDNAVKGRLGGQTNMNHRLALLPVVGALLIIATPGFAGIAQTPEPSTVFLIGGGLGALILFDRYRRAKKK